MELLAAIDLRGGAAVRLLKGDYEHETSYGDPIDLATSFIEAGTDWLHLVDLDAARDGGRANRAIVRRITAMSPVPVETGGGIRTMEDVDELIDLGVQRVILGTVAIEEPAFVTSAALRHPGKVAVGLDYRRRADGILEVALRGWKEGSGVSLSQILSELEDSGCDAFVVTAIDRDGTLTGPDIQGLELALDATNVPIVASGGVSGAHDLRSLRDLESGGAHRSVSGVVVGKAIVEGRLTIAEAVLACR